MASFEDDWLVWPLASAGEAGTATTVQQGVVHEHAVGSEADETPIPCSDTGQGMREAREELRVLMLDQPSTGRRETYSDGFAQGLSHAINRIDAALAASLSLQPDDELGDGSDFGVTGEWWGSDDGVTPAMIEAGDEALHEQVVGSVVGLSYSNAVRAIYVAMRSAVLSQNTGASMGGDNAK